MGVNTTSQDCSCRPGTEPNGALCNLCQSTKFKSIYSNDTCSNCPIGFTSMAAGGTQCNLCAAGYIKDDAICSACTIGNFKQDVGNATFCTLCPNDQSTATIGATSCGCKPGLKRLGTVCVACDNGYHKNYVGDICDRSCPDGMEPDDNKFDCVCKAGYTPIDDSVSQCVPCQLNTYKERNGNGTCTSCSDGEMTENEGATTYIIEPSVRDLDTGLTLNKSSSYLISHTEDMGPRFIRLSIQNWLTNMKASLSTAPGNGVLKTVANNETINGDIYPDGLTDVINMNYYPNSNFNGEERFSISFQINGRVFATYPIVITVSPDPDQPNFSETRRILSIPSSAVTAGSFDFNISVIDGDQNDFLRFRIIRAVMFPRHLDFIQGGNRPEQPLSLKIVRQDGNPVETWFNLNDNEMGFLEPPVQYTQSVYNGATGETEYFLNLRLEYGTSGGSPNPLMYLEFEASDSTNRTTYNRLGITFNVECPSGTVPNVWSQNGLCSKCITGGVCNAQGLYMPYNQAGKFSCVCSTFFNQSSRLTVILFFKLPGYTTAGNIGSLAPCTPSAACLEGKEADAVAIGVETENNYFRLKFSWHNSTFYSNEAQPDQTFQNLTLQLSQLSCSDGYNGTRCSVCSTGYFRKSGACEPCPQGRPSTGVLIALAVLIFSVTIIVLMKLSTIKELDLGNISIGITFFQILAIFLKIPNIQWPAITKNIFDIASVVNLDLNMAAPECLTTEFAFTYDIKYKVMMALPVILTANIFVVFTLRYMFDLFVMAPIRLYLRVRANLRARGQKVEDETFQKLNSVNSHRQSLAIPPKEFSPSTNGLARLSISGMPGGGVPNLNPQAFDPAANNYLQPPLYQASGNNVMVRPRSNSHIYPELNMDDFIPATQNNTPPDSAHPKDTTDPNDPLRGRGPVYKFGIQMVGIWLTVLSSLYLVMVMKSIEIFNCVDIIPGNPKAGQYLLADPSRQCYDDEWRNLKPFAFAGLIFYALGIMLIFISIHILAYQYDPELEFPRWMFFGKAVHELSQTALNKLGMHFTSLEKLRRHKAMEEGISESQDDLSHLLGMSDVASRNKKLNKRRQQSGETPLIAQIAVDVLRSNKSSYMRNYAFWDVFILIRKLLISLSTTFISGSLLKCLALQLIFTFALFFQMKARPYTKKNFDRLEETVLFCLQLVLIAAVTFYVDTTETQGLQEFLGYAVVVIVAACSFIIVILSLWEGFVLLREFRRKDKEIAHRKRAAASKGKGGKGDGSRQPSVKIIRSSAADF